MICQFHYFRQYNNIYKQTRCAPCVCKHTHLDCDLAMKFICIFLRLKDCQIGQKSKGLSISKITDNGYIYNSCLGYNLCNKNAVHINKYIGYVG